MSASGPGRPPVENRFKPGESGNPKGRPKSQRVLANSAFDVVIDRTLTLTQGGKAREVTVEEALQHKTYQAAIAGNRAAQREVLKMIAKREKWLQAARAKSGRREIERLTEPVDPRNADEAMLLLGVAKRDPYWAEETKYGERLLLQTWAVQAALSRPGRRRLSAREVSEINRCTQNAEQLKWPASVSREEDR